MNKENNTVTLIEASEGPRWNALSSTWCLKLCGHDTGGAFALLEQTLEPGAGTPEHIHTEEDETLYILEGEADLWQSSQEHRVCAGTTIHLPRGTAHGLMAAGSRPCRILHILTPAGLENYFREANRQSAEMRGDWNEVVALSAEYGIRFLP